METRICKACKQELPIEVFPVRTDSPNRIRRLQCDSCLKKRAASYREKNRQALRDKQRAWANSEHGKKMIKKYAKENTEKIRQMKKKWRDNNPEKVRVTRRKEYHKNKETYKQYRIDNREKISERMQEYGKKNRKKLNELQYQWRQKPGNKIAHNLRCRLRLALNGTCRSASTKKLLGCDFDYLIQHLEKQFQEGMTWDNYGDWHIDHIRPCSSFDLTDKDQQKECFHYTNLQPLWAADNLSKGAKDVW